MAFRIGLRRASRLLAYDSFVRVASTTGNLAAPRSATTVARACFESRPTGVSQWRPFCSGKDIDTNNAATTTPQVTKPAAAEAAEAEAEAEEEETSRPSKRHDLAMLFTCKVCETRSAKTMSRATYETGIVIVRCPKCRNLHLIADRLGWFGEPGSVEDFLEHQGVSVRKGLEGSYEFSVDDLAGWTPPHNESSS